MGPEGEQKEPSRRRVEGLVGHRAVGLRSTRPWLRKKEKTQQYTTVGQQEVPTTLGEDLLAVYRRPVYIIWKSCSQLYPPTFQKKTATSRPLDVKRLPTYDKEELENHTSCKCTFVVFLFVCFFFNRRNVFWKWLWNRIVRLPLEATSGATHVHVCSVG